jgi:hypothetical protein
MVNHPEPKKIPLVFFRTLAGNEPVREWLKELPEQDRQTISKDLLRAMALAGGHASVPPDGRRAMGGSDRSANESDRARPDLLLPRAPRRAARVHQENPCNSR